ncbi:MAG: hypothetical protein V4488_00405 [Pseudomonadota bacterium]
MNRNLPTQLKRYAKLLALWAATGVCGILTALLLTFFWASNQDTVSVYHLQVSEQHTGPWSLKTAMAAMVATRNCNLEASVSPGMTSVSLKLDMCGPVRFYYFRQHTKRLLA